MSATLSLGLTLQLCCVLLLFATWRWGMFKRVGTYFVLAAFTYHGITEVIQVVSGTESRARGVTSTSSIDLWTVIAGGTLLLFTIAYIVTSSTQGRTDRSPYQSSKVDHILSVFDWKLMTLLCLPLIVVASSAPRQVANQGSHDVDSSSLAGLAGQFLVLCVTLATIGYVAKHPRGLVPAVLLETAAISVVGSRTDVIAAVPMTLFGLGLLGRTPRKGQVTVALSLALLGALSINSLRAQGNRPEFDNATSVTQRLSLVASGAASLLKGTPAQYASQQQPLGERLDGNSFPAAILDGIGRGSGTVGLVTVENDALLTIPSFIDPLKRSTALEKRSDKEYLRAHYSVSYRGDFLPTQLGSMLAYYGVLGLLTLGLFLGLMIGLGERALRRRASPLAFVATIALLGCMFSYEGTILVYLLAGRGVPILVAVMVLIHRLRLRRPASAPQSRNASVSAG